MAKFLIIRFSSIGDIVLTTPVIRVLKTQVDGAIIHFLTKKSFASMVQNNPYIDECKYLGEDWAELIDDLKKEQYDYIIDLHHNFRTWKIKRALKVFSFSYNKLNIEKWLYTNFKINRLPKLHIVDRNLETVKAFGVKDDGKGLDYFIPTENEVKWSDLPTAHLHGFIGVVIGAALATKQMPLENLKAICAAIQHPIILLGGPEDQEKGAAIAAIDPIKIYNACGKFNLNESADLVRKSKFIITSDTGLMHIAAAFKKPTLVVWGNTVPEFGMGPFYGNQSVPSINFEVSNLKCRPCSKIGYKKCPHKHFNCMQQQDWKQLVLVANQWLKNHFL